MPEAQSQPHCVILLSGGLDSTTLLAMAAAENHGITALSFRYGQRHAIELDAAQKIAAHYGVSRHIIIELDLGRVGGSALTSEIDVPKGRSADDMAGEIPVTYVPARNTIFLAYALAWAEVTGAEKILIGVNALDYSGYPDCRPEYIEAFQKLAALATKTGVEGTTAVTIAAPLINLTKAEIIRTGLALGVDYAVTTSCYDPSPEGEACGACDACVLRLQGFAANNMDDPAPYRQKPNRT